MSVTIIAKLLPRELQLRSMLYECCMSTMAISVLFTVNMMLKQYINSDNRDNSHVLFKENGG